MKIILPWDCDACLNRTRINKVMIRKRCLSCQKKHDRFAKMVSEGIAREREKKNKTNTHV